LRECTAHELKLSTYSGASAKRTANDNALEPNTESNLTVAPKV